MQKILIATTNPGKFNEIITEFSDLPFKFVSLKQVGTHFSEPVEPFATTWENALSKAKFYANKTGLLTIAEDTGFYVRSLNGDPGVQAKRFAPTAQLRNRKILNLLKKVSSARRGAYFETHACVYNPVNDQFSIFRGTCQGRITSGLTIKNRPGMTYDAIFYYPPAKKFFAEMSVIEKNLISHRGQILHQLKIFLARQYEFKQFIAPLALIIKNKKVLLLKRRDSRPAFNNKWEFPGGGVERGETVEQCLRREVKEETGYAVKILYQLPGLPTAVRAQNNYQVFLLTFVCRVTSGIFKTAASETADHRWCVLAEALRLDLLPLNKKIIRSNISLLKKYLD